MVAIAHIGEPGARRLPFEKVTDNRQRDRHAGTGTGALHDAPCQQRWQRPRKGAADTGDSEQHAGEQHDRLATIPIGHRSIEQRRDGEPEHEEAHHQAGALWGDAERGPHRRERRQAHVKTEGW
jgi:hypothetical protein